jgi:hypothetical protein
MQTTHSCGAYSVYQSYISCSDDLGRASEAQNLSFGLAEPTYTDHNSIKRLAKFVNKPVPDWGTICHI